MSGNVWVHKHKSVTVAIDRERFSAALAPFASELNRVAEDVAAGARAALPSPSMRRFIGYKPAGVIAGNNRGIWRLQLRGRRYASGTGDRLMRDGEVPIALVTNNSALAMVWEYGGTPSREAARVFTRGRGASVRRRMVADERLMRQYQPLTIGAQRAAARAVIKYRRPRRAS